MGLKRLLAIKELIRTHEMRCRNELLNLQTEAMKAFEKMLNSKWKKNALKEIVSKVETSKELTAAVNDEWYHSFARVDFSTLIDTDDAFQKEMLKEFLNQNYSMYVDFKNDCLTTSIGPCLIVNHDGDVLDQDSMEWVISKSDYETREGRNALIEAYMKKSGYFPSVVYQDYHGNVAYIDTQSEEQKLANKKAMEDQNGTRV